MTKTPDPTREHLTWEAFGEASRVVARDVLRDGFVPDVVVAIARGGLMPAGAMAYALGIKACGSLNVEFYANIDTPGAETLAEPTVLPPLLDTGSLHDKQVLLVDDVADSGRTLRLAVDLLERRGLHVRSATIFVKPTTIIHPDYSWKATDKWIDFPWSWEGPVEL